MLFTCIAGRTGFFAEKSGYGAMIALHTPRLTLRTPTAADFPGLTDHASTVSHTHPDNARSHKLAEAVGALLDPTAPCPYPPCVRICRHPSPKAPQ